MRVAEHNRINFSRIKREWLTVTLLIDRFTLKQSAVEQDFFIAQLDQVARTRYFTGGAVKR